MLHPSYHDNYKRKAKIQYVMSLSSESGRHDGYCTKSFELIHNQQNHAFCHTNMISVCLTCHGSSCFDLSVFQIQITYTYLNYYIGSIFTCYDIDTKTCLKVRINTMIKQFL